MAGPDTNLVDQAAHLVDRVTDLVDWGAILRPGMSDISVYKIAPWSTKCDSLVHQVRLVAL
jgi:hypothetical protein